MIHSRRDVLKLGAAGAAALASGLANGPASAEETTLSIAYNVNLPSWDPADGPSAVNPTIQGIYQSVFDQYIGQKPDLSFTPGLITEWAWTDDNKKIRMKVRKGVTWHDGSPFTPEDVVWSLQRAADPKTGNPINFVWSKVSNLAIADDVITADVKEYDAAPIGTGPYMVEKYERNAFVRLKANPKYWGDKPAFETAIIKFVPDAASRVAEVESGKSQVTFDIPYEEFDRLKGAKGLTGVTTPVSDIAMIFLTNVEPVMLDKNVRLAACHAIDKKLLVDRLLKGYGVPIDTLQAPEYPAFDPTTKVAYDPELSKKLLAASGYTPEKPAKFTIQTTKGFKPKDYEIIQAIVGMWRKVGIEANIEIYDIAKHFELRFGHKLAPAAFYNWGNAIGDPSTSTGFAMFGPSPHCAWKSDDLIAKIGPLWGETDEAKRIAGYKAVDKYIAEEGYVIPLFQYVQPIIYASSVKVTPNLSGAMLPQLVRPA
jgi:peptide/nickel transport system substrate-binding protein